MLGPIRHGLLISLLLVAAIVPSQTIASPQHLSTHLYKRDDDGRDCYKKFAKDPSNCPIINVAFFADTNCATPLPLARTTPRALIEGNEQMLFDGTVAHSLKRPFGSLRIIAAARGMGLGFAKGEESDTVVQNMAFMSAARTFEAFSKKECVTFPNLDASQVGVWTARQEASLNVQGYVWNPDNIPIKRTPQYSTDNALMKTNSHRRRGSRRVSTGACAVCLEEASWGGGGVLLMYTTPDCTSTPKKQLYSTVQCTPLSLTDFRSYKAVQPLGPTIDTIFSPTYYDVGQTGYHACAHQDVSARPFKPNECQKMAGGDMFVGVYGLDPDPRLVQPALSQGDKVLAQGHGKLLLGPKPGSKSPSGVRFTGP
ncbi:hypothetical protein PSEUBRA_000063 [Kalmanozyma brasiliensis GHG001]|uniref:Uncharacterized protein n=1 Tax=Kalmanozyma brasiliensis (strain GHG001) TaxID=1365824 RepID=V5F2N0_KALBG|nr:uncharacterized protein PSEUBRA_000063 [Kalmanozyma brasiliensis GHG001]EST09689.1 hypothetical protein PSEUBRA_000063 [Kalmanozyma brasiliensis GHG001]